MIYLVCQLISFYLQMLLKPAQFFYLLLVLWSLVRYLLELFQATGHLLEMLLDFFKLGFRITFYCPFPLFAPIKRKDALVLPPIGCLAQ